MAAALQPARINAQEMTWRYAVSPRGFRNRRLPEGFSVPGFRTDPIQPMAIAATPTQTTGHHRRDGGRPSGNSRMRNATDRKAGPKLPWRAADTARGAGTDPGLATSPSTGYTALAMRISSPSPAPIRIQPILFRARTAMSRPRVAKATPASPPNASKNRSAPARAEADRTISTASAA